MWIEGDLQVRVHKRGDGYFPVKGLSQGCVMSPWISNIYEVVKLMENYYNQNLALIPQVSYSKLMDKNRIRKAFRS